MADSALSPARPRPSLPRLIYRSPYARAGFTFLVLAVIWEILGRSNKWPLVMPPMTKIIDDYGILLKSGELQRHTLISLQEFLLGFALAAVVGLTVGVLLAVSDLLRDMLDPLIAAVYATPVIALAPVFIIVFGIGISSKIAVVFLLAVFPIIINTATGIRATDQVYIDTARAFSASRLQTFRKVLLPSAFSFILTGLRLGVGRGLVGVVAGELFGARGGLGFLVLESSQVFDAPGVWVGVFTLAGMGIIANSLLQRLERKVAPWRSFRLE